MNRPNLSRLQPLTDNFMKTFTRHRSLEELKDYCKEKGWKLNTTRFEAGDDSVSFKWKVGKVSGLAVFNTFNGKIIGQTKDGVMFSSDNTTHENEPWFSAMLEAAYVS